MFVLRVLRKIAAMNCPWPLNRLFLQNRWWILGSVAFVDDTDYGDGSMTFEVECEIGNAGESRRCCLNTSSNAIYTE
jgi:hypothetical protein